MYFITTVSEDDTRCVGYYKSKAKAIATLKHNTADLYEAGCYPYAVIEDIPEGLYQYDLNPMWTKYDKDVDGYVPCEQPDFVGKRMVGFAIG